MLTVVKEYIIPMLIIIVLVKDKTSCCITTPVVLVTMEKHFPPVNG